MPTQVRKIRSFFRSTICLPFYKQDDQGLTCKESGKEIKHQSHLKTYLQIKDVLPPSFQESDNVLKDSLDSSFNNQDELNKALDQISKYLENLKNQLQDQIDCIERQKHAKLLSNLYEKIKSLQTVSANDPNGVFATIFAYLESLFAEDQAEDLDNYQNFDQSGDNISFIVSLIRRS